jgi:hypothetical protein
MWTLVSVRFETMLVSVQEMRSACAKRTTGSGIVLDTPDGTPR